MYFTLPLSKNSMWFLRKKILGRWKREYWSWKKGGPYSKGLETTFHSKAIDRKQNMLSLEAAIDVSIFQWWMRDRRLSLGLGHEYLGRIIGVDKCLVLESAIAHIAIHSTIIHKGLHVAFETTNLLDASIQVLEKCVTSALHKPKLEVTVAREQVLIGRCATFQIGCPEERKNWLFAIKSGDGNVERPKISCWFFADKDDAMRGEKGLYDGRSTVPFKDFFPKPSIFT